MSKKELKSYKVGTGSYVISDPDCVVCYGCGMETEYYYYGETVDEGVMPFCPDCVGNR